MIVVRARIGKGKEMGKTSLSVMYFLEEADPECQESFK